jgi:hypothetical protein
MRNEQEQEVNDSFAQETLLSSTGRQFRIVYTLLGGLDFPLLVKTGTLRGVHDNGCPISRV